MKISTKKTVLIHCALCPEFQWVTSLEVTSRILEDMILAGRGRWKIENEGVNNQKHGIFRIEHLNSKNSNAMKNHYMLTQISDILMQLYLAWNPYIKELKQTIKNQCIWNNKVLVA